MQLDLYQVEKIVENALKEDIGSGDLTTESLFLEEARGKAVIIFKEEGILAGLPVTGIVFKKLEGGILWEEVKVDGERVGRGQVVAELTGSLRAILKGERTALNFLQRLSGIATLTARFVEAVADFPVKIMDTRKTAPGLRVLDKYAVRVGGGLNHRFGLYDGVIIKENHVRAVGGISKAVESVKKNIPSGIKIKIEVETSTLDEVREALHAQADIIMLDNMPLDMVKEAVSIIGGRALVEVSGGVTLEKVRDIAATGVDFISVGTLTHSPEAIDISLEVVQ